MNRVTRAVGRAVSLVVVVAIVGLGVMAWFYSQDGWRRVRDLLAAHIGATYGREVSLAGPLEIDAGWPDVAFHFSDITVESRRGEPVPHLLHVDAAHLVLDVSQLLRADVVLPSVVITAPDLHLLKDAAGHANWTPRPKLVDTPDPAPESRGELPVIEQLHIDDGRVHYRDERRDIDLDMRLSRVAGSAADDSQRVTLKGKGSVRGTAVTFEVTGGSLETLRETNAPYPIRGRITAGATRARFDGSVRDPMDAKGFDLTLDLAGNNAAEIYALTGIALLPTPPYQVHGRLNHLRDVWRFDDFTGRMGQSDLTGSLRWQPDEPRSRLFARFAARRLALADLGSLIGVRERPEEDAEDDGRVLPDVPLATERLDTMDADVVFDGERVLTKRLPLNDFHLRVQLERGVLRVAPVRFRSGTGALEGWATVDATRSPPGVEMRLALDALPLGPLFEAASEKLNEPNLAAATLDGHGNLRGRGRSLREMLATSDGQLRFEVRGGQLSQIVIELVGLDVAETAGFLLSGDQPVPIRCMLADLEVADGKVTPRAFVLDTTDTVVTGRGSIDLDGERLDLTLTPEPKDFSPLSLRAPLVIEGTLGEPTFGVQKRGLIARGVAAAALALAFPPAAIAALFEPGTGEDANCRVLLQPEKADGHTR